MNTPLPRVLFSPCSIHEQPDQAFIVVHRPMDATDVKKQGLSIAVGAYAPFGWIPEERRIGQRLPCFQTFVWCSADEREQWDRGTGGEPGKPREDTSGPVRQYLTKDAPLVERAIVQARAELLKRAPPRPHHELVREAVARLDGGEEDGGVTALATTFAGLWGLSEASAKRALKRYLKDGTTSAKRLFDILTVLGFETSRTDVSTVPIVDYGRLARDSAESAEGYMAAVGDLRTDFNRGRSGHEDLQNAARYTAAIADHTNEAAEWASLAASQGNPADVQAAAKAAEKVAGFVKSATKLVQDLTERFKET